MTPLNQNNLLNIQREIDSWDPKNGNFPMSIIHNDRRRSDISPETKIYLDAALAYIETVEAHIEIVESGASSDEFIQSLEGALEKTRFELKKKLDGAIASIESWNSNQ